MPAPLPHPRVAVVIPALDEAATIGRVIARLPPVAAVIVADNGSTDDTVAQAEAAGARVVPAPRRGYGSACQAGIAEAQRLGADVVVILDADLADDPAELPRLLAPIQRGDADLVLSERTRLAEPGALLSHQRFGNRLATTLIAWTAGARFRDMGPFRAIRMDAILSLRMEDPTWGWNVEMALKAARQGLQWVEVPMAYRAREGVSKISGTVRGSVRAGGRILWAVWRYR